MRAVTFAFAALMFCDTVCSSFYAPRPAVIQLTEADMLKRREDAVLFRHVEEMVPWYDSVAAGALAGWATGKFIAGDPTVMAIAGAMYCTYASRRQPLNRLAHAANRLNIEYTLIRLKIVRVVNAELNTFSRSKLRRK